MPLSCRPHSPMLQHSHRVRIRQSGGPPGFAEKRPDKYGGEDGIAMRLSHSLHCDHACPHSAVLPVSAFEISFDSRTLILLLDSDSGSLFYRQLATSCHPVCMHACMYVRMQVCRYVGIYIHTNTYTHTHTHTHVHMHACIHIYTIHTCMHTYICSHVL